MKTISLEGLRDATDEENVMRIVTEYMMEAIARDQRYKAFERLLNQKKDSDTLTVGEIREKLESFNEDSDIFV